MLKNHLIQTGRRKLSYILGFFDAEKFSSHPILCLLIPALI
jgi:hypothetical protein